MSELVQEPENNVLLVPGENIVNVDEQRKAVSDIAASHNSIYLVAVAENTVIGFLVCRGFQRQKIAHTTSLSMGIHKEWRNKKVGTALMEAAMEWAIHSETIKRVELSVYERNTHAIQLYKRFGFEVEGVRKGFVIEGGHFINDILMARIVKDA
jgi:ribosomal protein S18 acetylase RimI-like enzyme